uniref:RING-type domain-containing protein n=1 Tax=Serinus canaria TaxID=9135 RepID=A0A8C9NJ21_SERCA
MGKRCPGCTGVPLCHPLHHVCLCPPGHPLLSSCLPRWHLPIPSPGFSVQLSLHPLGEDTVSAAPAPFSSSSLQGMGWVPLQEDKELDGEEGGDRAPEDSCVVCLSRPRECVLLGCGHICCCFRCFQALPTRLCPICRGPIDRVVPLYQA